MFAQFARWFAPSAVIDQSQQLYIALVNQARQPIFYTQLGVPDSLDGRFEMILLHLFLFHNRIRQASDPVLTELANHVTDYFVGDMDRSLREIGVGDMSVGKRVKKMSHAYNGRMTIYTDALADRSVLAEALRRNVYGTLSDNAVDAAQVQSLAEYVLVAVDTLDSQPADAIASAEIIWPANQHTHPVST